MPTVKELLAQEGFFDAAVMWHGFTDYMRDSEQSLPYDHLKPSFPRLNLLTNGVQ